MGGDESEEEDEKEGDQEEAEKKKKKKSSFGNKTFPNQELLIILSLKYSCKAILLVILLIALDRSLNWQISNYGSFLFRPEPMK